MTFIILLLCLSLERFFHRSGFLMRFNWFERYLCHVYTLLKDKVSLQQGFIALSFAVLPIVLLVGLIYFLSTFFIHGLLAFLASAFVLFYCLGPLNIYTEKRNEPSLFWQANETLFAVIFWFTLLGPIAALVYRLMERTTQTKEATYVGLVSAAEQTLAVLDWLPVRLFSMLYALAGNFVQTSQFCLDYLFRDPVFNRELMEKSGRISIGLEEKADLSREAYLQALKLIDRSLLLFLMIVFAVTLGVLL